MAVGGRVRDRFHADCDLHGRGLYPRAAGWHRPKARLPLADAPPASPSSCLRSHASASRRHRLRAAVCPQLLFPVVGTVDYHDDFGEPRGALRHQGNDLLGDERAPVVAVEEGTVKYWTTSSSAGCMLYLYGASGTMYEYIHLNNDLTARNDNKGKCVGVCVRRSRTARTSSRRADRLPRRLGRRERHPPAPALRGPPEGQGRVDPFPFLKRASHLSRRAARRVVVHAQADRHTRRDGRSRSDAHRADDRVLAVAREADEGQPPARADARGCVPRCDVAARRRS